MSHLPTVVVDRTGAACALGAIGDWSAPTRRGSLTTGQDSPRRGRRGAMTEAILAKNAAAYRSFGFRHWNGLTPPASACSTAAASFDGGSHRGSRATKLLGQHLRPPSRAKLATKPEPMGSATPANTGPTPLSSPFM